MNDENLKLLPNYNHPGIKVGGWFVGARTTTVDSKLDNGIIFSLIERNE